MKKLISVLLVVVLALALVACGGSAKKQEAVDAFNSASEAFNTLSALVNENPDVVDEETFDLLVEYATMLNEFKTLLESEDLSDEQYDEAISIMQATEEWSLAATAEVEAVLAG